MDKTLTRYSAHDDVTWVCISRSKEWYSRRFGETVSCETELYPVIRQKSALGMVCFHACYAPERMLVSHALLQFSLDMRLRMRDPPSYIVMPRSDPRRQQM